MNPCKACVLARRKATYVAHRDEHLDLAAKRYAANPKPVSQPYVPGRRPKTPESHRIARRELNKAIRRGDIARPSKCDRCGQDPGVGKGGRTKIRAHHHNGYDPAHWFDVEWVCDRCDMRAEGAKRRATRKPYRPKGS